METAIQMDRTLNNNIFHAKRGENVLLSAGLEKENAGYISRTVRLLGYYR